jgi:hypothetical protein
MKRKYLRSPRVERKAVPSDHRMIGVTSYEICDSLQTMDPSSAISRAMTEVMCLREEIDEMVAKYKH